MGTALVIGYSIRHITLSEAFAVKRLNQKVIIYILPAIVLGLIMGMLTRERFELTYLPAGFTGIAFVAPLIGAMEELVFRGYFQGKLRPIGLVFLLYFFSFS